VVKLTSGLDTVLDFASDQAEGLLGNPVATAVGGAVLGAAVVGTTVAVASAVKKKRRKASTKRKSSKRRSGARRTRKSGSYARTAGK